MADPAGRGALGGGEKRAHHHHRAGEEELLLPCWKLGGVWRGGGPFGRRKEEGRQRRTRLGSRNIFCLPTWVRNVAVVAVAFVAVVAVVATSSVADASSVFPFGNVGKLMIFHSLFTGFSFL